MTVSHVVLLSGLVPLPLVSSSKKHVVFLRRTFVVARVTDDIEIESSWSSLVGSSAAGADTGCLDPVHPYLCSSIVARKQVQFGEVAQNLRNHKYIQNNQ